MHALDKALGDPAVVLLLCVTGGWRCPSAPDLGALTKRGEGKHSREKRRSNKFKAKVDQGWVKEPVYLFSTYSMLRIENSGIFKNFILYWGIYCCCLVAKSCQTLCDPMDCRCQAPLSMELSRQEYCSGLAFPSPGDFPNPGTEPGSPALQVGFLPLSHQGSPYWGTVD